MSLDDDADDDAGASRPPLPPEDRLWRHPSELGAHGLGGAAVAAVPRPREPRRGGGWSAVVVAGLAGAVLAAGLLAIGGHLDQRVIERPVVEKVAVTPIVSTPMLRGDSGVAAVVRRLQPSIVRLDLTTPDGPATGSGVVFRTDGMVLTSAHLVDDATRVDVRLSDGRRLPGTVIGLDRVTDVAVVDVDAERLPVAILGSAKDVEVGAPALTVGCPQRGSGNAVTTGVISAVGRTLTSEGFTLHGLLQTDAPVTPSTSGGALVNASGVVIGLLTAFDGVASEPADAADYGFATPIDLAHRVALQLIAQGRAVHGWLGIEGVDLDPSTAADLGVPGGALVRGVDRGSPAERAGLGSRDVITDLDGAPVESMPGLAVEMREHEPGDEVRIGYWRDGTRQETAVTVGERPTTDPSQP